MKTLIKYILLFALSSFFSCAEENFTAGNPDFILSFIRDGKSAVSAGTTFYAIPKGSSEFLTLYDGSKGHVWGEEGATGAYLISDSFSVKYDTIGVYKLTMVATSVGERGNKIDKQLKSVSINVIDDRNSFSSFYMNGAKGTITSDNQIQFSFPDVTTNFTFTPIFNLASNSKACKVTVGGVEQISEQSQQTFTPSVPIVYTVTSPEGTSRNYSVVATTYKSSSECSLTRFSLSSAAGANGNGETGLIDQAAKTITLTADYSTLISAVKVIVENSYNATTKVDGKTYSATKAYALTVATAVKVTAQDKVSTTQYALIINQKNPVEDFTFVGFNPAPIRTIDTVNKTITIDVAKGTDVSNLIATWTGSSGVVSISTPGGKVIQSKGSTANDFSTPRVYTFYKGNKSNTELADLTEGDSYTVTVNFK